MPWASRWRTTAINQGLDSVDTNNPRGPAKLSARFTGSPNLYLTDAVAPVPGEYCALLWPPVGGFIYAWFFGFKPDPTANFPYGFSVEPDR